MIRHFQQQDEAAVIQIWLEASAIAHSFIPRSYWESKIPDHLTDQQLHRRSLRPSRPARTRNRANPHGTC